MVCANAYALPSTEKPKEKTNKIITEVISSPVVETNSTSDPELKLEDIKISPPQTLEEKFSYVYSYVVYLTTLQQYSELDPVYYAKGAIDAQSGQGLYTKEEIASIMQEMQQVMLSKAQEQFDKLSEENLEKANQFLEENKTKPGIITTDSGLQYEILKEGQGESPESGEQVVLNYSVYLMDGTLVGKSSGNAIYNVNSDVSGLSEGLQLMKQGGKYRFYVHPNLAYGLQGTNNIEPNSLLIFEVELISIQNAQKVASDIKVF